MDYKALQTAGLLFLIFGAASVPTLEDDDMGSNFALVIDDCYVTDNSLFDSIPDFHAVPYDSHGRPVYREITDKCPIEGTGSTPHAAVKDCKRLFRGLN